MKPSNFVLEVGNIAYKSAIIQLHYTMTDIEQSELTYYYSMHVPAW